MGLELTFHSLGQADAELPGKEVVHEYPVESEATSFTNSEQFDDSALTEAAEAQLLIDDPFAFEKVQISKDIERNRQLA